MAFCGNCFNNILVGESFIRKNLRSRFKGLEVLIIPHGIMPSKISVKNLKKWSDTLKASYNSINNYKNLDKFKIELSKFNEYQDTKNQYSIDFIYFNQSQAATKMLKLIKDIPPSRLDKIRDRMQKTITKYKQLVSAEDRWNIDLNRLYGLLPINTNKPEKDFRRVLDMVDSIFTGKPIDEIFLIKQFASSIKNTYYNSKTVSWLESNILLMNEFLLFFRDADIIIDTKEGVKMDLLNGISDEGMLEFIKECSYDAPRTALFLLGTLIADIGSEQYRTGKKTILNILNFQGISREKLLVLINRVFEKMVQYKVTGGRPETIYAVAKGIIDRESVEKWPMSSQENIFYILSGYSYKTFKILQSGKNKKQEENSNE